MSFVTITFQEVCLKKKRKKKSRVGRPSRVSFEHFWSQSWIQNIHSKLTKVPIKFVTPFILEHWDLIQNVTLVHAEARWLCNQSNYILIIFYLIPRYSGIIPIPRCKFPFSPRLGKFSLYSLLASFLYEITPFFPVYITINYLRSNGSALRLTCSMTATSTTFSKYIIILKKKYIL